MIVGPPPDAVIMNLFRLAEYICLVWMRVSGRFRGWEGGKFTVPGLPQPFQNGCSCPDLFIMIVDGVGPGQHSLMKDTRHQNSTRLLTIEHHMPAMLFAP